MAFLLFCLVMCIVLQHQAYKTALQKSAAPVGDPVTKWKVTFKAKKTPPMELEGESEPLVLRALMAKKIDYHSIAAIERIP